MSGADKLSEILGVLWEPHINDAHSDELVTHEAHSVLMSANVYILKNPVFVQNLNDEYFFSCLH